MFGRWKKGTAPADVDGVVYTLTDEDEILEDHVAEGEEASDEAAHHEDFKHLVTQEQIDAHNAEVAE